MPDVKKRLLRYYSLTEEEYEAMAKPATFDDIPLLPETPDLVRAKTRIELGIKKHDRILIYGDYDADGIMSASIIKICLRQIGSEAQVFIPSRYLDGYGLTMENAVRIANCFDLVILVDNGVSSSTEIRYLKEKGVDVIVLDHHEIGECPPLDAFAFVHPDRLKYGPYPISAGELCFGFSRYLLNKNDEYLAILAGISTISDCMPLRGYNQKLVSLTLHLIVRNNVNQILDLTSRRHIDEKVLGMEIIPQINSVGRMEEGHFGNKIVDYFAKSDRGLEFEQAMVSYLRNTNQNRKDATKKAENELNFDPSLPGISVVDNLPEGLNGLLANKLLNEYDKPIMVFSPSRKESGVFVGSARSKEGFNVMEFWKENEKILERFGGHDYAGGASVKQENLDLLQKSFLEFSKNHPFSVEPPPHINLILNDLTPDLYPLIRSFGPFGTEHEEPLFRINEVPASMLKVVSSGKCMKTNYHSVEIFSFQINKEHPLNPSKHIALDGKFRINEYNGKTAVRFECSPVIVK